MGEIVVKYVGYFSEHDDHKKAAALFKLAGIVEILASLVAFSLVWLLAPLGAQYLAHDPSTVYLFHAYSYIILANMIGESSLGLLQIYDRFGRVAMIQIIQSICTLVLITITFFAEGNILGILLAYVGGKFVGAIGLSFSALKEAENQFGSGWWKTRLHNLLSIRRDLINFAISTNISASLSLITKDSEVLWVSLLRNPTEAGYYKLALSLANIVQLPIAPLPQATYPEISRQAAHNKWANMKYIMRQGSRLAGSYSLLVTIFLVIFGRQLIAIIYTPQFLPAYPALLILLTGYLVANIFYWRRVVLLAFGEPGFPAKVNSILASLKMLGVIFLVPAYGYLASAALLSGFYWAGSFITAWKIRLLFKQQEQAI